MGQARCKENTMTDKLPMSRAAYDKLHVDLEYLKKNERPAIIEEIAVARAQGDLSENAEYHAAKEKQGMIEDKISEIESKIARAEIMTADPSNSPHIIFGAVVTVKNLTTGKSMEYTLVGSDEVDPLLGKISSASPVGQSLIGKKKGDVVEAKLPKGPLKLEILDYR
jgi:transcription elongation factor GreA